MRRDFSKEEIEMDNKVTKKTQHPSSLGNANAWDNEMPPQPFGRLHPKKKEGKKGRREGRRAGALVGKDLEKMHYC